MSDNGPHHVPGLDEIYEVPTSINIQKASQLSWILTQTAKVNNFSRVSFSVALAMASQAVSGVPADEEMTPEIRNFLAGRFEACAKALRGGLQ